MLSILEKMVFGGVEILKPSVDDNGRIYYPEIKEVDVEDSVKLLDELSAEGVLVRISDTRLVGCPIHEDSMSLVIRLKCPTCHNRLLRKGSLAQHACGYIGNEQAYTGTCPKCGKVALPQSLRRMGVWYECDDCKGRFAGPEIDLYCSKYEHEFHLQEVRLVDQASYRLVPEAGKEFREKVGVVVMIRQGLGSLGLKIEPSFSLQGSSGVKHTFDFVVHVGGKKYFVDVKVAAEGVVNPEAILATYLKSFDTGSSPSVVVAIPQASPDSKTIAKAYGIQLVEGAAHTQILEQLRAIFKVP